MDRVLACVGARRWWAALSGRARVQRLAEAHLVGAPLSVALRDASAYGLAARGRLSLGGGVSLSGVVEVPDARWLPAPSGLGDGAWWGGRAGPQAACAGGRAGARPASPSPSPPSRPSPSGSSSGSSYGSAAGSAASPGSGTPRGRGGGRRSSGGGGKAAAAQQPPPPGTPPARRRPATPPIPLPPPSALAPLHPHPHLSLADRRAAIPADLLPRASAKLAARLPGGHEAAFSLSAGNDYVDAAASSSRVPLVLVADLAALPRDDGIQYRVGVHRVWAPADEEEGGAEADAEVGGSQTDSLRRKPSLRSVAHVQGAVAVEGEAVVWQRRRPAAAAPRSGGGGDVSGGGPGSAWLGQAAPPVPATAPPAEEAEASSASSDPLAAAVGADWVVDLDTGSAVAGPGSGDVKNKQEDGAPPAIATPAASALQARLAAAAAASSSARALVGRLDAALRSGGLLGGGGERSPTPPPRPPRRPYLPGLGPPRLAVTGAVGCLGRMPLPDGLLLATMAPGTGTGGDGGRARRDRSPPAPGAPSSSSPARPPPIRTGGGGPTNPPPPPLPPRPWWRPALPRALDSDAWAPCVRDTSLRVFASAGASAQLGTFTRRVADYTYASLRVDAGLTAPGGGSGSGGMGSGGGVGSGADPFSSASASATPLPSSHRPRGGGAAFALEGRGVWHALSASLCQQVVGPLRVRADARFALESAPRAPPAPAPAFHAPLPGRPGAAPAAGGGGAAAWGGAAAAGSPGPAPATAPPRRRHPGGRPPSAAGTAREALREAASRGWAAARAARPTLLETAYGVDYVLPGTEGSLRLVGWWSPARREGMVELRLL